MRIKVINTGVSNIRAIPNMLRRLNSDAEIATDPDAVRTADCIILPGVGSYDAAIRRLREQGIWDILNEKAAEGTPFLGICLGMQLMAEGSEEGEKPGFGWFRGGLKRFRSDAIPDTMLRVPHMGWNLIREMRSHPLYAGMEQEARFYFDHSYYFVPGDSNEWCGATDYGVRFASGICRDNLYGVQFHPEKSHRFGLRLFQNFLSLVRKL